MKKLGQLMEELGFRKDAPEEVKKAFIESLSRTLSPEQQRHFKAEFIEGTSQSPATARPKATLSPEQLSLFENPEPTPRGKTPRAG